jgi:CheY-like chemotaxis protein
LNTLLKIQKSIPGEKINYKEEESLHFNISPNPAHGKESSNTRILVVDDDEINLYLARSILNQLIPGAVIIEANNGKQAIEEFKNNKPDIIFLDIQMPSMNGYDVCKEIRKLEGEPKVRIIALTAGTVKGDIDKCFQVGMDDYASKPVKKDLFQKIIEKWL